MKRGGKAMIYVALLRGINIGGNNKIDMKRLKGTFERVGMKSVKTYINSGNVIFEHSIPSKEELALLLEHAIYEDFLFRIKVLIKSCDDLKLVMETLPSDWKNDQVMKSDVLFLWADIDNEAVLNQLSTKPGIDTVLFVPGAILWMVAKKDSSKSGLVKLVGNKLYKKMTIRNVNSARKIYSLMQEISDANAVL